MSTTVINGVHYITGSKDYYNAMNALRAHITQIWAQAEGPLQAEIDGLSNASERKKLSGELKSIGIKLRGVSGGDATLAEKSIGDLREKIISARMEERMLADQRKELSRLLSRLEKEAPAGFREEIMALRRDDARSEALSLRDQTRRIATLTAQANKLAQEATQANAISLAGLEEERVFLPPAPPAVDEVSPEDKAARNAALVTDICDFGARVAFFDEGEAEGLKPLVMEAKEGASDTRLHMIRDRVKTAYGRLKERAVLTDLFKRDLRDFLPAMRKAQGTEDLCARMEGLLAAPAVTREEYNDVRRTVETVFSEQEVSIEDAMLAERVGNVLGKMGYTLLDEEGGELRPGRMRTLAAPYDGYRVQIKVSGEGQIATRLVRVVGAEEERAHVSEYQRQKDIAAGRKWCSDLNQFYGTLEEEGLAVETILRREPEEEDLVVVLDPNVGRAPSGAAKGQQGGERLRERKV